MLTWLTRRTSMSKFFTYAGDPMLACPCCGDRGMNTEFLNTLDSIRAEYGQPMIVSSGYRCATYNAKMSSTGFCGPHTTGRAIDIKVFGEDAIKLIRIALNKGMTGVGVKQHGPHNKRFVHLDDLSNGIRPWIWSY